MRGLTPARLMYESCLIQPLEIYGTVTITWAVCDCVVLGAFPITLTV